MSGSDAGREYVREMREAGHSDDEIRRALLDAGWTQWDADILLGRQMAPPPPPPPARAPAPPPGRATSWTPVLIACAVIVAFMLLIGPILAAILFPVFGRAREKAREASCMSNVKQLCTAHLMYVSDYDEVTVEAREWPRDLMPYLQDEQIFVCPADEGGDGRVYAPWHVSYAMNSAISARSLATVRSPARTGLLWDGTGLVGGADDPMVDFRHGGRATVGYVDGHVRGVEQSEWQSLELRP